jgi:hypothetical protein
MATSRLGGELLGGVVVIAGVVLVSLGDRILGPGASGGRRAARACSIRSMKAAPVAKRLARS